MKAEVTAYVHVQSVQDTYGTENRSVFGDGGQNNIIG